MSFVLDEDVQEKLASLNAKYGEPIRHIKRTCSLIESELAKLSIPGQSPEQVIYLLGRSCLQQVNEMLALCVFGYGTGALKILRPLYETIVTLDYLVQKPEEISQYIDYSWVHWHKIYVEFLNIRPTLPKHDIVDRYEEVKARFQQTDCKKCKTKRLQQSWTKKGIPDLAEEAKSNIRPFHFASYVAPTLYIHTTYLGQIFQFTNNTGTLAFNSELQKNEVDNSIGYGALLILHAAVAINWFFKLGLEPILKEYDFDVAKFKGIVQLLPPTVQ